MSPLVTHLLDRQSCLHSLNCCVRGLASLPVKEYYIIRRVAAAVRGRMNLAPRYVLSTYIE